MLIGEALTLASVAFPSDGGIRVQYDPTYLRDPPFDPGQGPNRFDDPAGLYSVRYLADTLRGCLLEVLARFAPDPATEAALGQVDGLNDPTLVHLPDPTPEDGLAEWLTEQKVGRLVLDESPGRFVDAYYPDLLTVLDALPGLRAVLDDPDVLAGLVADTTAPPDLTSPLHLSLDIIQAAGSRGGRRITQAISRVLFTISEPALDGLAYRSRHDATERCWALSDHVSGSWPDVRPLSPTNPEHREALLAAADLLNLTDLLPPGWTRSI